MAINENYSQEDFDLYYNSCLNDINDDDVVFDYREGLLDLDGYINEIYNGILVEEGNEELARDVSESIRAYISDDFYGDIDNDVPVEEQIVEDFEKTDAEDIFEAVNGIVSSVDDIKINYSENDETEYLDINVEWGDWKHDHLYLDNIIEGLPDGWCKTDETVTDSDGSDTYSSIHRYARFVEDEYNEGLEILPDKNPEGTPIGTANFGEALLPKAKVGAKYKNKRGTILRVEEPDKAGNIQYSFIKDGRIIDIKSSSEESFNKMLRANGYEPFNESIEEENESLTEELKWPNGQKVNNLDLFKALQYMYGTDVVTKESDVKEYTDEQKQKAINYYVKKVDESLTEAAVPPEEYLGWLDQYSSKSRKPYDLGLPTDVDVPISELRIDVDDLDNSWDVEDAINDYLSDEYGYLVNNYSYNIEGDTIKVRNISWDIDESLTEASKLDVISSNKKAYQRLEKEIENTPDGLTRDIMKELGLRWCKGNNWAGGLPDRVFSKYAQKIVDKYGVSFDDVYEKLLKFINNFTESLTEDYSGGEGIFGREDIIDKIESGWLLKDLSEIREVLFDIEPEDIIEVDAKTHSSGDYRLAIKSKGNGEFIVNEIVKSKPQGNRVYDLEGATRKLYYFYFLTNADYGRKRLTIDIYLDGLVSDSIVKSLFGESLTEALLQNGALDTKTFGKALHSDKLESDLSNMEFSDNLFGIIYRELDRMKSPETERFGDGGYYEYEQAYELLDDEGKKAATDFIVAHLFTPDSPGNNDKQEVYTPDTLKYKEALSKIKELKPGDKIIWTFEGETAIYRKQSNGSWRDVDDRFGATTLDDDEIMADVLYDAPGTEAIQFVKNLPTRKASKVVGSVNRPDSSLTEAAIDDKYITRDGDGYEAEVDNKHFFSWNIPIDKLVKILKKQCGKDGVIVKQPTDDKPGEIRAITGGPDPVTSIFKFDNKTGLLSQGSPAGEFTRQTNESLTEDKNETLNPALWEGDELKPEVKEKLKFIADTFIKKLEEDDIPLDVDDIIIVGSNANYNFGPSSDIDLHIVADLSQFKGREKELAEKIYQCKKAIFNDKYDPMINGFEVEIYVEPAEDKNNNEIPDEVEEVDEPLTEDYYSDYYDNYEKELNRTWDEVKHLYNEWKKTKDDSYKNDESWSRIVNFFHKYENELCQMDVEALNKENFDISVANRLIDAMSHDFYWEQENHEYYW